MTMADYMLMVLEDETAHATQSPMEIAELIENRTQFVGRLRRTGKLRDSGRFRPSKEGKRVRRHGDQVAVEDGPFTEALGSYVCVKASSLEEATQLATEYPVLAADEVAVRRLVRCVLEADKEGKPGKIFGFVVRGAAQTEEAWVKVMDRINAESAFPSDAFLGGVRLEEPTAGRRIATRGERRATFDGPFLESKEVIGGVFFLRMASLEDAVSWAGESRFVVHGSLEIRELWRS